MRTRWDIIDNADAAEFAAHMRNNFDVDTYEETGQTMYAHSEG